MSAGRPTRLLRNVILVCLALGLSRSAPAVPPKLDCNQTVRELEKRFRMPLPWQSFDLQLVNRTFVPAGRSRFSDGLYFMDIDGNFIVRVARNRVRINESEYKSLPFLDMKPQSSQTCFGACALYAYEEVSRFGFQLPNHPCYQNHDLERVFQTQGRYFFTVGRLSSKYRSHRLARTWTDVVNTHDEILRHLNAGGFAILSQQVALHRSEMRTLILWDSREGQSQLQLNSYPPWNRWKSVDPQGQPDFILQGLSGDQQMVLIENQQSRSKAWIPVQEIYGLSISVGHEKIVSTKLEDGRVVVIDPNHGWPILTSVEDLASPSDEWDLINRR